MDKIIGASLYMLLLLCGVHRVAATPTAGLYFMLGTRILPPDESVVITDIGGQPVDRNNLGTTLVCVTDNVNMNCCRGRESGGTPIGDWIHNNELVVPLGNATGLNNIFVRIGHTRQIRLAAVGHPTGPVGNYTCSVPDANGIATTAIVRIINFAVTSVSITPTSPSVTAGSPLSLTCQVNTIGRGRGNLTISWTGQTSRDPITTQIIAPGMYTDTLTINRASQVNPSVRCEARIGDSTMSATKTFTVTDPVITTTLATTNNSPTIGQMITLTCNSVYPLSPDHTMVAYAWMRNGVVVSDHTSKELTINPIQLADNNTMYTCESVITSPYLSGTVQDTSEVYQLIIIVTVSSVQVLPDNPMRQEMMDIVFTCTATLSSPGLPSFTWSGPSMLSQGPTTPARPAATILSNTLTIDPVMQSHTGTYTCQVSIGRSTETDSTTLLVTVDPPSRPSMVMATPQATSVLLTWSQSSTDVVDSYNISYMRTAGCPDAPSGSRTPMSGSVRSYDLTDLEEHITYDITLTAINTANQMSTTTPVTTLTAVPDGSVRQILQGETNLTSISLSWQPLSCLQQNGPIIRYNIRYNESSNVVSPLSTVSTSFTASSLYPGVSYTFEIAAVNSHNGQSVGPYTSMVFSTRQPTDFLFLRGTLYSNNSLVNIEDIGEDSDALLCLTNITQCCSRREWFYPNNNKIGNRAPNIISRTRGPRSVNLHRDNTLQPVGIFRCQINNDNVYVGIYPENSGSTEIQSLTYNTASGVLTCTSTGGPATDVTWNRGGQVYNQNKIVDDTVNGIYYNLLTITSSQISDYTGSFTCIVRNTRGSSSRTTGEYKAIGLSGDQAKYDIGSSASVTCFSNLTVLSIRWINMSSDVPFTTEPMGLNELRLTINVAINRELHESMFSCETVIKLPSEIINTSEIFTIRTDEEPSGPVANFLVEPQGDTEIQITWRPPDMPGGMITDYSLRITNLKDNTTLIEDIDVSQTTFTSQNLEAGIPYNISVAAVNSKGAGNMTSQIVFTKELKPNIAPQFTVERTSATTMAVSWNLLSPVQARGFVKNYTIFYSPASARNKRQQTDVMSKTVDENTNNIVIDGLDESLTYSVQISADTAAGTGPRSMAISVSLPSSTSTGPTPTGSNSTIIIIVIIVLFLLAIVVVAIIIVVIVFMRKRGKSAYALSKKESVMYSRTSAEKSNVSPLKEKESAMSAKEMEAVAEEQTYENTEFIVKDRKKPVAIEDFGGHVSRMHADRDKWFEMEYNAIEKSSSEDFSVAAIPDNRARNRFGNIYPYNFNRVVLSTLPDVENSDYINASFVDGYERKKVYIAAQGPIENSVEDFWRMIWEQRSPTIVMLTRVFEGRKKCEEYWPQNTTEPFIPCSGSPFRIDLKSALPFAEFVIKKMTVTKTNEPDARAMEVCLYHYLGWPDHGVPANAISMINFIRRVRKSHPYSKKDLMLVHCSAGVGRTGTFITLDYMLERIKSEKSINIYEFVSKLRKQRVLMVQTLAQYVFIHNSLDELITCGDTEVAAANMRIVIGKLGRPVEAGSATTGFQKQFKILQTVTSDLHSVDFSQSINVVNSEKNRYEDKVPFNHTRVRLRPGAAQGSDYINASFVEGYRQKGAYIATQGPLANTVVDFWKMIWEQECRCIVMLCKSEENGKEVCHRYWPSGKGSSETFGKLTVTLLDQKVFAEYVMRKLEVVEHQARKSITPSGFTITQFQYLKWAENVIPTNTSSVLEIANLVQKVQMSTGNKSIVVMCNDGMGRTGTFICMHAQMERMKSEHVADAFQFIKSVRFQRAGLMASKDQYKFCHHVMADFLDGFDTYANFKEIV